MELGKRKNRVELYIDGIVEGSEKRQKRYEFENNLRQFYKKKWNCPVKPPTVHGIQFDLYRLYDIVMALGGWQKVSQQEKWADVAEMFGVREDILGGDNAIKVLYMRYLSKFEQNETIGDLDDMMDSEMMRARGRQHSFLATSECPVYIPRPSNNEYPQQVDYSRLTKSLLCGLPNEEDFAVNICTLLSHPGPRLLHFSHAPHILTLLLAHIGIFDDEDDEDLSDLYEAWKQVSGRDFIQFWASAGVTDTFLQLFMPEAAERRMDQDELFVGIIPEMSTSDPLSWRVYQTATVLRNLSFEIFNRPIMASHWPLIKFLLLCSNSEWCQLCTAALDTLSNLACDIDLTWTKLLYNSEHALLQTLHEGIYSNDKFKLIRCMEVLAGLCNYEGNEPVLCDFVSPSLLSHLFEYLVVKDIMLCVYTLECLYQISEMGCVSCTQMAELPHAISMLVSLATIEAVSFGHTGLAGMKVVEFHPPGVPPLQNMPTHFPPPSTPQMVRPPYPPPPQQTSAPPSVPPSTPKSSSTINTPAKPIGESKVEQLTAQWIRSNCEADPRATTSRGDLYAAYVDDLRNHYHSLSGSLQMFTNAIKNIYPEVVFRLPDNGTPVMVAHGVRLIKPHSKCALNGHSGAELVHTNGSHPLMQQMLSNGTGPEVSGREVGGVCQMTTVEASHPLNEAVAHEARIHRVENKHHEEEGEEKKRNGVVQNGKDTVEEEEEEEQEKEKEEEGEEDSPEAQMMCEWDGCARRFMTASTVLHHTMRAHVEDETTLEVCKWPGCDATPRSRWSLITHLQDHHCTEAVLREAALKRAEGRAPPKPAKYCPTLPRDLPQHPGYSKNAAVEAIRRHAFNFISKDFTEDVEGPVTKSIRLTSCLILRNLARYSPEARGLLRRHERSLCWIALSRMESNSAVAQLLAELHQPEIVQE